MSHNSDENEPLLFLIRLNRFLYVKKEWSKVRWRCFFYRLMWLQLVRHKQREKIEILFHLSSNRLLTSKTLTNVLKGQWKSTVSIIISQAHLIKVTNSHLKIN